MAADVEHFCVIKYELGCCGLWVISNVYCSYIAASKTLCPVTLMRDAAKLSGTGAIVRELELV
jgi:hypothetical protein